jgi:signal transduction histidine kinase
VAHAALPDLADWCVVDIVDDYASIQRLAVAHVDAEREAVIGDLARRQTPDVTSLEGVAAVLRSGCATVIEPNAEQPLFLELGAASGIIAPLVLDGRVLGALSLGAERRYDDRDLALADELASLCAQALDNAQLFRNAREATELRGTLLATISHDLKNPLATIGAQAQLLRRLAGSSDSDRLNRGFLRIEAAVERMSRMIDGLLDVTQLELGGHIQLTRTWMDLVPVANQVVAEHQERSPRHRFQIAGEPSLVGHWDLARMERVLDNLISNAVKYSPNGGVVTVICVKESGDALLSVRDQGVGIPADDVGRIFERFHRAGNVGSISGTGIGLATIRDIVEQHGGTITVDSCQGSGSTFTIRLPMSGLRL